MQRFTKFIWLCTLAISVVGCATYQRHDLNAVANEAEFRDRTLADPGLYAFIYRNATTKPSQWPPRELDLRTLTLAAFYFHPDLDVARAKAGIAEAGIVTAGQRPNPTFSADLEKTLNIASGVNPYTLGLSLDIPIETAGKRGYRIAQAKALSDAARLEIAEAGWAVRSRLRGALMNHLLARRDLDALQAEQAARSEAVTLLERRLAAGQVSVVEVDIARIDADGARLAAVAAQGQVVETRAALAAAIGLPASALDDVQIRWPELDTLPDEQALSRFTIQRAGLLNRLDVRRLLAEYAATEAALRLEIAKQYPDIRLGPDYTFENGDNKFGLGLIFDLPVFNQNQGSIAEAQAKRRQAAAQFMALQAQVIGQTAQVTARYRSALAELAEADRLYALQQRRFQSVQRSVEVGEDDLLTLASARVQSAVTARSRLDALRKAQAALGALEDVVQRPLDDAGAIPDVPTSNPRDEPQKEVKR